VTSGWFFLSTLNYDARSTTHQIYCYCLSSVLNRKAPRFSETLVKLYQTTRRHITGGLNLYSRRPEKENLQKKNSYFGLSQSSPLLKPRRFETLAFALFTCFDLEREREGKCSFSYNDVANCEDCTASTVWELIAITFQFFSE
jgi:hypothetical protein